MISSQILADFQAIFKIFSRKRGVPTNDPLYPPLNIICEYLIKLRIHWVQKVRRQAMQMLVFSLNFRSVRKEQRINAGK